MLLTGSLIFTSDEDRCLVESDQCPPEGRGARIARAYQHLCPDLERPAFIREAPLLQCPRDGGAVEDCLTEFLPDAVERLCHLRRQLHRNKAALAVLCQRYHALGLRRQQRRRRQGDQALGQQQQVVGPKRRWSTVARMLVEPGPTAQHEAAPPEGNGVASMNSAKESARNR